MTVKGGGPALIARSMSGAPNLIPAVVDTLRWREVSHLIVANELSQEERQERELIEAVYGPGHSLRKQPNTERNLAGKGWCADNLALAAGWIGDGFAELDLQALVGRLLPAWLRLYCPSAVATRYYVLVLDPDAATIVMLDVAGRRQARFSYSWPDHLDALAGVYALYEEEAGQQLVDVATRTVGILPAGNEARPDEPSPKLEEIVDDRAGFVAAIAPHWRAGERMILLFAPPGKAIAAAALHGGTGRLEDYGSADPAVNAEIHARNLAVCRNVARVYDAYLHGATDGYVAQVKATQSEDALRALGPPLAPYQFPRPVAATDAQFLELLEAMPRRELDAWAAVATKLDELAGRASPGKPVLRFKVKYEVDGKKAAAAVQAQRPDLAKVLQRSPASLEIECNWDVQLRDGVPTLVAKKLWTTSVKLKGTTDFSRSTTDSKVPVEVTAKLKTEDLGDVRVRDGKLWIPPDVTFGVKVGPYGAEFSPAGKAKLSFDSGPFKIATEADPHTGETSLAATFSFKNLAKAMAERAGAIAATDAKDALFLRRAAEAIRGAEVTLAVGFTGLREEAVLAVVSGAPGFFERRSTTALLAPETLWNQLTLAEQASLGDLGWTQRLWDCRYRLADEALPASVSKHWTELTAPEKVAIVHLGFATYEDYRTSFRKRRAAPPPGGA